MTDERSECKPDRAQPSRDERSECKPDRAQPSRDERSECKPDRAQPSRDERSECKPARAQPSRQDRPPLVVVCGPPCSGKTTLASKLHGETGLVYLAIDSILQRIVPGSSFDQADRDLAYRILGFSVEQLLLARIGVIVDATFTRAPHLENLEVLARKCNARLFLVECRIDVAIAIKRFQDRGGKHPAVDLDEARVEQQNQSYPYKSKGLTLDTSRQIDECLTEIRRQIGLTDS
jgi:predicted kinase